MAKTGRNDPCPCGSGNKFKKCCGSSTQSQPGLEGDGLAAGLTASVDNADSDRPEHTNRSGDSRAGVREGLREGLRYLLTAGAPDDPARGVALIERAARAGDPEGAYLAATFAAAGFWRVQNWAEGLDYLLSAAQGGNEPAQGSLRILASGPSAIIVSGQDWPRIRSQIKINEWLSPPAVQMTSKAPRIHVVKNFAPPAACDWLIARAQDRLSHATIYDRVTGGVIEDNRRTNSQCDLDIASCGLLTFVFRARIAAITGTSDQALEIPKILHYAPGETFAEHCDYLDPAEPAYAAELAARGQRIETFLVYLNDGYTGGETHFPRIDLSHSGTKGEGLLFKNVNSEGAPDHDTMHAGLAPTSGEKWVFSQWIRELPRA